MLFLQNGPRRGASFAAACSVLLLAATIVAITSAVIVALGVHCAIARRRQLS
jgi:hypothetical protein